MEETRPIDQQEEVLLDAIARALILIAKEMVQPELNDKNKNKQTQQIL